MSDYALPLLLMIQLCLTCFMSGLIWFVQVVHYPLLADVGGDTFARYESAHVVKTTWVVAPAMLLEVAVGVALTFLTTGPLGFLSVLNLGILLLIWMSTAFFQVPAHGRLVSGLDPQTIRQLVATNWLRTVGWTLRSGVSLGMLVLVTGLTRTPDPLT